MKKTFTSAFIVGLLLSNSMTSQTNLNFENWTGNEPNGWVSSNAQTTQSGGAQTVFKETTAPGQGSASVKMVTGSCPECPNFTTLGFSTPLPNPLGGDIELEAPYSLRPISVDFKYKSNPIGNDAGGFYVKLTRYNSSTNEDETIGEGYFEAGIQVTNWTNMNIPIVYYSNLIPDAIYFWATSSIGSIPDLTSLGIPYIFPVPTPVAGSEFYIDAININLPSCAGFGLSVNGTNATAPLAFDGTATANPSGGTPPYTYSWSNLATTSSISGLAPGLYSATVTDANGCVKVGSYNILPFSCGSFAVSVTGTNATSFTSQDGTASATVTGGTGPYTYLWNTGATTSSISGLQLGAYAVSVTDATGNCVQWGYFPSNSAPIGIQNYDLDNNVSIFPNPSNGRFIIKSSKAISEIIILNAIGKSVYSNKQNNTFETTINLSELSSGIYFYQLKTEGSGLKSGKLIIE